MRDAATTYENMHNNACRALRGIHEDLETCAIYADLIINDVISQIRYDLRDAQREIDVDAIGHIINHVTSIRKLASTNEDDNLPF